MPGHLVLLYHFFHPDDVISARLFSELGEFAAVRGWKVSAFPSTRSCHAGSHNLARKEVWQGVDIHRVWRPGFSQTNNFGRLLNSFFMLLGWTWRAVWLKRENGEVVVVGTDPVFAILIALPWRLLRPKSRIVHWCHDMHPEASIADGQLSEGAIPIRILRFFLRASYRNTDVVVDLGPCMRDRLCTAIGLEDNRPISQPIEEDRLKKKPTASRVQTATITPWSLVEPNCIVDPDIEVRRDLFGRTQLGLLYSGNLGKAHDYERFLELARELRSRLMGGPQLEHISMPIKFCFAGRGAGMDALKQATALDTNIRFSGFADQSVLEKRLAACDIHLVSLKDQWTGTVVPSKFFGALAIGRPVLFVGSADSAIARWIDEFNVGWVLTKQNVADIADQMEYLSNSPLELTAINSRCWQTYQNHFCRETQLNTWMQVMDPSR